MHLCGVVAQCLFRSGFHLVALVVVLQTALSQDVEVQSGMAPETAPCSCDCCLVAEREPGEIATLPDGTVLNRKCVSPPVLFETDTCGARCNPSDSEMVLTAVQQDMDMSRYCTFLCRPATKTVGTVCNRMDAKDIANSFSMDGNGNADTKAFTPLINSEESWGAGPSNARFQSEHEKNSQDQKRADGISTNKEKVTFDIREVITMRKRAEAAGNIARAAAAESSTKANRVKALNTRKKVDKVLNALQESAGAGGAAVGEAAQQSQDAGVAAVDARVSLAQARAVAKQAATRAQDLAKAEIKKAAAAAAKVEAEADAYRYGWDKPPNWDRVIAQQSAMPYLQGMVAATWRASEYEGYAKGILGQAKGAQGKAKSIMKQANMYRATGDSFKAKVMEEEVKGLISKSHSLEAEANAEWKKADNLQHSIAEWQQAAVLAAGHGGWAWKQYFTPPPTLTASQKWRLMRASLNR